MNEVPLNNKYSDINISSSDINSLIKYLTNQLWKLIPMRENNEPWRDQIRSLLIELKGFANIFSEVSIFLSLISKLEGLLVEDIDFFLYRKIIFECIDIVQKKRDLTLC